MLVEKGRSTIERPFPKIWLTDRKCGRTAACVPFRNCGEEIRERQPINPNPRYGGGKAQDCHRGKGSVALGERQAYKSAETDKIRTDKRIKMVILQTEW